MTKIKIIDATNAILGRLASFTAKQALLGKSIVIVNCNDALITGNKADILEKYKQERARGGSALKGPNFPRSPERLLKRTIRGMLKYKRQRGEDALRRIICYNDLPKEFENTSKIKAGKDKTSRTIKLKELSRIL